MTELMLNFKIPKAEKCIRYTDKIAIIGSCFTEHIGNALMDLKFTVLQNPNGILFDPASVAESLVSYTRNQLYTEDDLFLLGEIWNSWHHHSRFSGTDKAQVLNNINASQDQAHLFLAKANWLIITLGSSFSYRLKNNFENRNGQQGPESESTKAVANCHRAPAQWFQKYLMPVNEIIACFDNAIHQLFHFNPHLNIIFTISPVRHIRDGVIENNRSKARLIEAVHYLVNKFDQLYYFPSYELVIDVLRDYRFYAEDLAHPNYLATNYVLNEFIEAHFSEETKFLIEEIKKINRARNHHSAHPHTKAHQLFLKTNLEKAESLQQQYPFLNLSEEIAYFSTAH